MDYSDVDESFELYSKEIGRFPLLTYEDEKILSYKIKQGDELARKNLINSNLRFVVFLAKKFRNRGLSFSELIEEGNIGLMKATEKYDCSKGVKFATYSQWLIKQQIRRSLHNKGRLIRIPLKKSYLLNKISSLQDDGFSLRDISKRLNVPYEDISYLLALSQQQTNSDFEIQDTRYSPNLDSLVLKETLNKIMSTSITTREKKILELRYGLNGQETYTLREIGAIFGIKRQRVDQLVNRALNKLKIPALKNNLEAFL